MNANSSTPTVPGPTTVPPPGVPSTGAAGRGRGRAVARAWAPFASLLAATVAAVAGGWLIDSSGLEQGPNSWGYLFVAGVLAAFCAPLPLVATLVTGIVGSMARAEPTSGRWAVAGAVVAAGCGLGLLLLAALVFTGDPTPAGRAFAGVMLCGSTPTLMPMVGTLLAARRRRRH